jgi:hypothetical protein
LAATGAVSPVLPGFNYVLNATSAQIVLNALTAITQVKVISSPELLVLHNGVALSRAASAIVTSPERIALLDGKLGLRGDRLFRHILRHDDRLFQVCQSGQRTAADDFLLQHSRRTRSSRGFGVEWTDEGVSCLWHRHG